MKNLRRVVTIAVLCAVALSLSSCLWIVSGKNSFTIDGQEIDIEAIYVASMGILGIDADENYVYGIQVFLAGDGVDVQSAGDPRRPQPHVTCRYFHGGVSGSSLSNSAMSEVS